MTRIAVVLLGCTILACGKPGNKPVLSSEVTDFRSLFAANCSGCHGPEGREGPGPPLNNPLYLRLVPREQLKATIENGRPGTSMPAFARSRGGPLYPAQITALADGIEQNWAKPIDLEGATLPAYSAPPGDAQHGQAVFRSVCWPCHGTGGRVGPLINASFLTLVSNQSLRTTIIVGRPMFGMPDWRHQNVTGGLSGRDVSDLVAWLAANRPATVQRPMGDARPAAETNRTQGNQGSGGSSIPGGPGASETNTTLEKHQ